MEKNILRGDIISVLMCIKEYYRKDVQKIFSIARETRIRNNGWKLKPYQFYLNIRIQFLIYFTIDSGFGFPSLKKKLGNHF